VRQKLEELLTTYQASYQNKNTYDKLFSALPTIPWVADRLTSCPLLILHPLLQSYLEGGTVTAGWTIRACTRYQSQHYIAQPPPRYPGDLDAGAMVVATRQLEVRERLPALWGQLQPLTKEEEGGLEIGLQTFSLMVVR
jgi:hypothetical protein